MNKIPFRENHLYQLLEAFAVQSLPLDLFIHHYFRDHPALGSKDRAFIANSAYSLIRWKGLLGYLLPSSTWKTWFEQFQTIDFGAILKDETIPIHHRVSFPLELFNLIKSSHGEQKAIEICLASNGQAPTTIRVNTLKTNREALMEKWKDVYVISPTLFSADGIIFHRKVNFFDIPEFKQGLFEVQDEGSQLLAQLIKAKPGDLILDYCAGSGGKTLALAPALQNKGQIYLHDIRPRALQEARKRLKRADIQNSQIILPDSPHLNKLKKKMDWVLVDAPCSGTGTLRRNPGMKWSIDQEAITGFVGQQRTIFEKALSFLHPEGKIVYGTCSLLNEENQRQLDHFLKTYGLVLDQEPFQSLPTEGGMDGFFAVVLKRI